MFLDNLSASVLTLCDEKRLTYEAASERCNLSTRYFGDIARRKTAPSVVTLEKLCIGFDTTPNRLLLPPRSVQEAESLEVTQVRSFGGNGNFYPICPRCRATLRENQNFCDCCGQSLCCHTFRSSLLAALD